MEHPLSGCHHPSRWNREKQRKHPKKEQHINNIEVSANTMPVAKRCNDRIHGLKPQLRLK